MAHATIYRTPFMFVSDGIPLVGRLHRNVDNLLDPQWGIVASGSWLTVKEQMADHYAARLAARGYTVLTFDFAGFGESHGEPRQTEMPARKIRDIIAASCFLRSLSCVRGRRVGYLGICASAQYALAAIADDAPIASFVSVAGRFHDSPGVAPFYGGAEGMARRLAAGGEATALYLRTGQSRTVPAYEEGNEQAGMFLPLDYYANPARGAVPEWTNQMAEMSWCYWLTLDGLRAAGEVAVPSLFVHGEGAVFPDNVRTVCDALTGPKEAVWLDGGQIDFYDRAHLVDAAVDAADRHFRATLPR